MGVGEERIRGQGEVGGGEGYPHTAVNAFSLQRIYNNAKNHASLKNDLLVSLLCDGVYL